MPSNEAIGKALVAMSDPRIAIHAKELRDNARRYYAGIKLNEQGLGYHKRASASQAFEGKVASTTSADGQVNSAIPEGWSTRPSVVAMRLRQSVTGGDSSFVHREELSPVQCNKLSPVTEVSPQLSPAKTEARSRTPLF